MAWSQVVVHVTASFSDTMTKATRPTVASPPTIQPRMRQAYR
jgi:hypothetical protein